MNEPKKWVGYADLLEAKRRREDREASLQESASINALPSTSQATQASQVIETSQVTETRQAKITPPDRSETSQVTKASQVIETNHEETKVNLMTSLPEVRGHTRFYHQIVDHLYPQLDAYEQATHFHLYRLSWGYNKSTCTISLQKLSERAGLSYKSAQRAVNSLERRGLISRHGRVIGYGKQQGIEIWVAPAPSQVTETSQVAQTRQAKEANNKENKELKEHIKRGAASPDFQNCPDCHGTGFYYPNGIENGVAKCRHEKLKQ